MDITFPEHARAFGTEVRTWLETNLPAGWFEPGFVMPAAERKRFFVEQWPHLMYDGGWICASWPKEYGGRGLDLMQSVALAEEFAYANAPMRVSSLGELLVGPTILQWGTDAQKREFLPRILRGELIWCQGFSEPASGSDLASLACVGRIEGDDIVVTGEKIWTSEAEDADYIFVLVRTNPESARHAGISFLLMPMRQPGVEVIAKPQPDGSRGFNRVEFNDAHCPLANVVGGVDNGWRVAMTTLGFERGTSATTGYHRFRHERDELFASARATGAADDRRVRQQLAQSWIITEIMRVNGYRALTNVLLERSEPALEMTHKVFWTDYSQWSTKLAVDVLGMRGQVLTGRDTDVRPAAVGLGRRPQMYDYPASPLQQSFFFARGESIYGGTSEIQRNLIAERVLGLPKGT